MFVASGDGISLIILGHGRMGEENRALDSGCMCNGEIYI